MATPWGRAEAAQLTNVFVTNDAAHAVPIHETNTDANGNIRVHEQGTTTVKSGDVTQVLFQGFLDSKQVQSINVAGLRTIRVLAGTNCATGDTLTLLLDVTFNEGNVSIAQRLDTLQAPCNGIGIATDLPSKSYDVPGVTVDLFNATDQGMDVSVFGRP